MYFLLISEISAQYCYTVQMRVSGIKLFARPINSKMNHQMKLIKMLIISNLEIVYLERQKGSSVFMSSFLHISRIDLCSDFGSAKRCPGVEYMYILYFIPIYSLMLTLNLAFFLFPLSLSHYFLFTVSS